MLLNVYAGSQLWMDSLEGTKIHMRYETLNVSRPKRSDSMKTVSRGLAMCKVDLVGIQKVRQDMGKTEIIYHMLVTKYSFCGHINVVNMHYFLHTQTQNTHQSFLQSGIYFFNSVQYNFWHSCCMYVWNSFITHDDLSVV
jgi:hypothetical protein